MSVSRSDFVKAWKACGSRREVASMTGLTPAQVARRAWYYRKRGVDLPLHQQGAVRAAPQYLEETK